MNESARNMLKKNKKIKKKKERNSLCDYVEVCDYVGLLRPLRTIGFLS